MKNNNVPYKIYLEEHQMPTHWLNLAAYMDVPPMLNPATGTPVTQAQLEAVFTAGAAAQELNRTDKQIPIPEEVRRSKIQRVFALDYQKLGRQTLTDFRNSVAAANDQAFLDLLKR